MICNITYKLDICIYSTHMSCYLTVHLELDAHTETPY